MDLKVAEKIACKLMDTHVPTWAFGWNNRKRSLGVCKYSIQTIELSKTATSVNDEASVIETTLHEIAHALTPGHGHDSVWRAKAISIGCSGSTKGHIVKDDLAALGVKWVMIDADLNVRKHWFRRPAKTTFAKLPYQYFPDDKEATLGKLRIVPFDQYQNAIS